MHNINALDCGDVDGSGNLYIANSVTSIAANAFKGCTDLKTISYQSGSTLESIEDHAFHSTGLTTITIPASVTSIGNYAFYSCSSLTSVSFESGSQLTSIGSSAFQQSGLTTNHYTCICN